MGAERVFWFSTQGQVTTPTIQEYFKETKGGQELAYRAVMPNLLSDPMWIIAQDADPARPEHALEEPFRRLVQG